MFKKRFPSEPARPAHRRGLLVLLVLLIVLTSCLPAAPAAPPATALPGPERTSGADGLPSASPTPFGPTSSPTPAATRPPGPAAPACTEKGRLVTVTLAAPDLGQDLEVNAYLPPCHDPAGEAYPTVVLLHGQGYEPAQWLDLGLVEIADQLIGAGRIPPLVILMPYERYALQDPTQSSFAALVLDVLLPWSAESLGACLAPACAAVGGISRGGAWALRLGLEHSDIFGAIGLHSTPPFPGDDYRFLYQQREMEAGQRTRLYMDAGEQDMFRNYITAFHESLLQAGIEHTWASASGAHDDAYWGQHLEEYLLWYSSALANAPE